LGNPLRRRGETPLLCNRLGGGRHERVKVVALEAAFTRAREALYVLDDRGTGNGGRPPAESRQRWSTHFRAVEGSVMPPSTAMPSGVA
jgi:hypothetical protein